MQPITQDNIETSTGFNPSLNPSNQSPENTASNLVSAGSGKSKANDIKRINAGLNTGQRQGAETIYGPVMIVASAGSGKTKTVINRCATMLLSGISPKNIMVVTFTSKAAEEIRERLEEMPEIGVNSQYICAGTFHSIILREIIKKFPDNQFFKNLGYDVNELVNLDEKDMDSILKEAISNLSEDDKQSMSDNEWKMEVFKKEIGLARANGQDIKDYISTNLIGSDKEELARLTANIWRNYQNICIQSNGIDFDDILLYADKMLQLEPGIAKQLAEEFKYIMLDEYQDTNIVQQNIMDAIASYHQNICTVGDDKQSIYKFRGSKIEIIRNFELKYPNTKKIELVDNYRSYESINKFANACSYHMAEKVSEGKMKTNKMVEETPEEMKLRRSNTAGIVEFDNLESEAKNIARAIKRDLAVGVEGKEVAVLYRSRTNKKIIEKYLMESDIPYEVVNDNSLYQSQEVRDSVALIRFLFHPYDNRAALRVMGATTLGLSADKAKEAMANHGVSVSRFLKERSKDQLKVAASKKSNGEYNLKVYAQKIEPLLEIQEELTKAAFLQDDPDYIVDILAQVWDIYMKPGLKRRCAKKGSDFESCADNISFIFKRVREQLKSGKNIDDVIEDLALMVDSNPQMDRDKNKKVKLMTMHASKGLEFENVYIVNADELTMIGDPEEAQYEDIEEARRLMYVAITRAMKKLTISYPKQTKVYGQDSETKACRFITEISSYTNTPIAKIRSEKQKDNQYSR